MNSFDKFDEEQLLSKEHFYSQLYEEHIKDRCYDRANVVWKHLKIKKPW